MRRGESRLAVSVRPWLGKGYAPVTGRLRSAGQRVESRCQWLPAPDARLPSNVGSAGAVRGDLAPKVGSKVGSWVAQCGTRAPFPLS